MQKEIYQTEDFDQMGWHDCKIYAMAFDEIKFKFFLDIDYIFEWINPENEDVNFKFLVSPATLVFENVYNLQIDIDSNVGLEIDEILRENPKKPKNSDHIGINIEYDWIIQLQQGELSFNSVGFKQIIKGAPILLDRQFIGFEERGGVLLT